MLPCFFFLCSTCFPTVVLLLLFLVPLSFKLRDFLGACRIELIFLLAEFVNHPENARSGRCEEMEGNERFEHDAYAER